MFHAPWVDVDRRSRFRETPGGAGMIEMNMAKENLPNVVRRKTRRTHRRRDLLEGRVRPGIEKRDAVVRLERGDSDDPGAVEVKGIEDVDQSRAHSHSIVLGGFVEMS